MQKEDSKISNIQKEPEPRHYTEFTPVVFDATYQNDNYIVEEYPDFDKTVEKYFANLELIKNKQGDVEEEIWKKFEKIKEDQEGRIEDMRKGQDIYLIKARLIEANMNEVQAVRNIINSMIQTGMNALIKPEINMAKKNGDPLANIIHDINLQKNKCELLLGDEENIEETMTLIEIDLDKNPYENAATYYNQRAKAIEKESKTIDATKDALKKAKDTAERAVKKHQQNQAIIVQQRKPYWFEKFYWFISSENFLVISARDSQQNEMLIKRYTMPNDIVSHTQIQGSAFTLIKNVENLTTIPD